MKAGAVKAERNDLDALFDHVSVKQRFSLPRKIGVLPRILAHLLIRGYQLSLSMLVGRHCRHYPSCSAYTDEAIQRFGLWRGGWIGLARICRCNPWGTSGIDIVCEALPVRARWYLPWRYGRWRGTKEPAPLAAGQPTGLSGPDAGPAPS
jgi:putative membrane protein insertion efficiency factor